MEGIMHPSFHKLTDGHKKEIIAAIIKEGTKQDYYYILGVYSNETIIKDIDENIKQILLTKRLHRVKAVKYHYRTNKLIALMDNNHEFKWNQLYKFQREWLYNAICG